MASDLQEGFSGSGVRLNIYWFIITNHWNFKPSGFVVSKVTPNFYTPLGYKMFLLFGTIDIGGMAVFALYVSSVFSLQSKLVLLL